MVRGRYLLSTDDPRDVLAVRKAVFCDELHSAREGGADEGDERAIYALAFDEDGAPAGSGRLYLDGEGRFQVGRVCVLKDSRGKGLGDLLMRMLLYRAQEMALFEVWAEADPSVAPFCARYGFKPIEGDMMRAAAAEINIEGTCHKA